ncbi:aminopeptidase [Candidatus Bathyarchaeota archaeon RBG_13_52_12]|nr:MAG: aminopeptidase [Candidatus Bathyarchaeota archaeon RBG_13_52_12]
MSKPRLIKPRARDLSIPFQGKTGRYNSITDVKGVTVGHTTIIEGDGQLHVGRGPVRTGVTAILPRGRLNDPVFAGWSCLNGNGEMTGTTWVEESGFLSGPIMITNTHSVGVIHDAVIEWIHNQRSPDGFYSGNPWSLPVVAETYDGQLNDINGFHVKKEHAFKAIETSSPGPIAEGNVGGGTGMICHKFKGGIGTSSRAVKIGTQEYVVGVLVQANYGLRPLLTIAGAPIGQEITDLMPEEHSTQSPPSEQGSIIVVIATDAPLLPHQLKRLARRAPMGIAKVGGVGGNGSGDIFIAFSTSNPHAYSDTETTEVKMLPNELMNDLFPATVQATEEAIVNALVAAETMTGINGNRVYAIPHDRLQSALKKYNRLT